MIRTAIMQPYLFPYIGYYQLINAVDHFIVYDNIKYTKKGWINRNRLLQNGVAAGFSVPIQHAPDSLDVRDRTIAAEFNKVKFLNRFREAYRRAPYFDQAFTLLESVTTTNETNLFKFLYHSLIQTCAYLDIGSPIKVSSELPIDHSLQNQAKVIALCQRVAADIYINPIGGRELYSRETFGSNGIELCFLSSVPFAYCQFNNEFVPSLSIIDVMMFNSKEAIKEWLATKYELV